MNMKKIIAYCQIAALLLPVSLMAQSSPSHFDFEGVGGIITMEPGGEKDFKINIKIPQNNHIYVDHADAKSFSILTEFYADPSSGFDLIVKKKPETELKDSDRILKGKGTAKTAGTYTVSLFEVKGQKESARVYSVPVVIKTQMCNSRTDICYRPAEFKKNLRVRIQGKKIEVSSRSSSGIQWEQSYTRALAEAKSKKKNVFVVITAPTWCGACVYLERNVFQKSQVADKLNSDWIPLQILDTNSDRNRFNFSGYPTMLVLDASGKELARIRSRNADGFLNEIGAYEIEAGDDKEPVVAGQISGTLPITFHQVPNSKNWQLRIRNTESVLSEYTEVRRDNNFVIIQNNAGSKAYLAIPQNSDTVLRWDGKKWIKFFDLDN